MSVDWSGCALVEVNPAKVGGRPVVKGTRVPADTIITDEELGASIEETHESFPSPDFSRVVCRGESWEQKAVAKGRYFQA